MCYVRNMTFILTPPNLPKGEELVPLRGIQGVILQKEYFARIIRSYFYIIFKFHGFLFLRLINLLPVPLLWRG